MRIMLPQVKRYGKNKDIAINLWLASIISTLSTAMELWTLWKKILCSLCFTALKKIDLICVDSSAINTWLVSSAITIKRKSVSHTYHLPPLPSSIYSYQNISRIAKRNNNVSLLHRLHIISGWIPKIAVIFWAIKLEMMR